MLIRLLTIYLDLNLFNKDCLFKTKIKKNCNTKVSALFFPIIVVEATCLMKHQLIIPLYQVYADCLAGFGVIFSKGHSYL